MRFLSFALERVGLNVDQIRVRPPYNGVHGDEFGVDLAALCALDLEVPGVVGISRDQLSDVLELRLDLKCEDWL